MFHRTSVTIFKFNTVLLSKCFGTSNKSYQIISPNLPPKRMQYDWVGPAHPVSNLCLTKFYIPPDESNAEKNFRIKRENLQAWNQKFWEEHNSSFQNMKSEYIKQKQGVDINKNLCIEEMTEFYKGFLDSRKALHRKYNKEWHYRNILLLLDACPAAFQRLKRKIRSFLTV